MSTLLTDHARTGFYGNANPNARGSAAWLAHELGRHLHVTGRSIPSDVRKAPHSSIRVNNMRFNYAVDATSIRFDRIE